MSCDVGKATQGLENELWRRWSDGKVGERAELSKPFVALPPSQLNLQPFCCFIYITGHSPALLSLLCHRLFTYITWWAAHGKWGTFLIDFGIGSFLFCKIVRYKVISPYKVHFALMKTLQKHINYGSRTKLLRKILQICCFFNANPLHYYVLRVPRKVNRWRWEWSIFELCTAWADHITCGMSICIVHCRKLRLGCLYV